MSRATGSAWAGAFTIARSPICATVATGANRDCSASPITFNAYRHWNGSGGTCHSTASRPNSASIERRAETSSPIYLFEEFSMRYWLMKSEPDTFGIADLMQRPRQTEHWDGVRNYQARNMLRDEMKKGDHAFFYHSSCDAPAIVDVRFRRKLRRPITLDELKQQPALVCLPLLRRGNRLSILPISEEEWKYILSLE